MSSIIFFLIFPKSQKIDNQKLACEGKIWGACFESKLWYLGSAEIDHIILHNHYWGGYISNKTASAFEIPGKRRDRCFEFVPWSQTSHLNGLQWYELSAKIFQHLCEEYYGNDMLLSLSKIFTCHIFSYLFNLIYVSMTRCKIALILVLTHWI